MTGYSYASGVYTATTTLRCPECLAVRVVDKDTDALDDVICCSKQCLKAYKAKVRVLHEILVSYKRDKPVNIPKKYQNAVQLWTAAAIFAGEHGIPYPR